MRILFITAFYPPYVIGGWEQLVQDINSHLQARGHTTQVLTSMYKVGETPLQREDVRRVLHLESNLVRYSPQDFFLKHRSQVQHNLSVTRRTIEEFRPEVIFIHVMWNLTRGVAWLAEQLCPGQVVYYVANDWPHAPSVHRLYWDEPARSPLKRALKGLLRPVALDMIESEEQSFPLKFERVLTVSRAVRDELAGRAGIPSENMQVVYNGVEVDRFTPGDMGQTGRSRLSVLYAGSLAPHKGVHTAIGAMRRLKQMGAGERITLTIVGSGHPDYEAGLRRQVAEGGLEELVRFWPRVPREEMPVLLRKFEVLVFPSIWEEPLARMMQEAMASGLVVVGTLTGGTPEILEEGQTGLTFDPEDAQQLAEQLLRLDQDAGLMKALARNGRRIVEERFDLQRMIDEIEEHLAKAAAGCVPLSQPQDEDEPQPEHA